MKNLLRTAFLLFASTVISLLSGEVIVRAFAPQRLDSYLALFAPDPDLVFRLQENFRAIHRNAEFEVLIETNSQGLRDKEIAPKQAGKIRILGLGDSFSFAHGVNIQETYFKQVEACLSGKSPVEVINCAVPANSLLQEIEFLKIRGPALEPDAVIVGFYVGNDFVDSYELFDEEGNPLLYIEDGVMLSRKPSDAETNIVRRTTSSLRSYLSSNSHLYVFLRDRFSELLSRMGLRAPIPPPEFSRKEFSPHMQKGWELTQRLLIQLSDWTRKNNQHLYVVVLPTIYQVYRDEWDKYVTLHNLDKDLYELEKPQRILADFCREEGIELIDLLPVLRRKAVENSLYYPVDAHMNAEGHKVVADSLCSYLKGRLVKGNLP